MIQTYIFTGCFCSYRIARKIEIKTTSRSDSLRLLTQTLGPKHIKATKKTAPPQKKIDGENVFSDFCVVFVGFFPGLPSTTVFFLSRAGDGYIDFQEFSRMLEHPHLQAFLFRIEKSFPGRHHPTGWWAKLPNTEEIDG